MICFYLCIFIDRQENAEPTKKKTNEQKTNEQTKERKKYHNSYQMASFAAIFLELSTRTNMFYVYVLQKTSPIENCEAYLEINIT